MDNYCFIEEKRDLIAELLNGQLLQCYGNGCVDVLSHSAGVYLRAVCKGYDKAVNIPIKVRGRSMLITSSNRDLQYKL